MINNNSKNSFDVISISSIIYSHSIIISSLRASASFVED